jgi:hypothetical protein
MVLGESKDEVKDYRSLRGAAELGVIQVRLI